MTEKLEVGTCVMHPEKGKGVVVPDLMNLCGPDSVMVDFDGVDGTHCHPVSQLEELEKIEVQFHQERCRKCIFAHGSRCHRYGNERFGWMLSSNGDRIIPLRIYPFCQEEICQASHQ